MAHGLSEPFLAALSGTLCVAEGLERELETALKRAREAHPEISVPEQKFLQFLATRVAAGPGLLQSLKSLRFEDLFLAFGCAQSDPVALRTLERTYLSQVSRQLKRMRFDWSVAEEVQQGLRAKLLLGQNGRPPRIIEYGGRGDLQGWVRVAAAREALNATRRDRQRETATEDVLVDIPASEDSPELDYLKKVYRSEFREAFQGALQELSSRDRNLLRHEFMDGMTDEEIGRLYQVHRTTALRWSARVRERLFTLTRLRLMRKLNLSREEVERIISLVRSKLDVSVRRFLSPVEHPEAP